MKTLTHAEELKGKTVSNAVLVDCGNILALTFTDKSHALIGVEWYGDSYDICFLRTTEDYNLRDAGIISQEEYDRRLDASHTKWQADIEKREREQLATLLKKYGEGGEMKLSIIVAHNVDGIIGINGKLPWHIPEDLKNFKRLTMGKPVIMGRKTWESLGEKPLPGRLNLVVSSSLYSAGAQQTTCDTVIVKTFDAVLHWLKLTTYEEAFVIGGEGLYRAAIPVADTIHRTLVKTPTPDWISDSDDVAYFPMDAINWQEWQLTQSKSGLPNSDVLKIETWERIL